MRKLKFYVGNYDGTREAMCKCRTKKDALRVLGISAYEYDQYYDVAGWDDEELAFVEPDKRYFRNINSRSHRDWEEG